MTVHDRILSRVLTVEFYRVNAMFFLVVLGLCFGFMSGREHMALAGFFVSSVWLALIPIGVWAVYVLKVVTYNRIEASGERNRFLYSLPLLGLSRKIPAYIGTATGEMAPVIAYGSFLALMALRSQQVLVCTIILISIPVMIIVVAFRLHQTLLSPLKEQTISKPVRWLDRRFTKPLSWMLSEGVVRSQPGLIYTTKIATCLVLYAATQLYLYDVYDERLYMMAACVVFSANLVLVYQYQRFEIVHLLLTRTLPLTFVRRIATFVLTMVILCFPEIAMLATNLPEYLSTKFYLFAVVFGTSLVLFGYGALYIRDATFDDFTRWIFFVSMALVLLILFSVPVWSLALVQAFLGIYLLYRNYYDFELDT